MVVSSFGSFGCGSFGCSNGGPLCDGSSSGVFGGSSLRGWFGGGMGCWASAAPAIRQPTPARAAIRLHGVMVHASEGATGPSPSVSPPVAAGGPFGCLTVCPAEPRCYDRRTGHPFHSADARHRPDDSGPARGRPIAGSKLGGQRTRLQGREIRWPVALAVLAQRDRFRCPDVGDVRRTSPPWRRRWPRRWACTTRHPRPRPARRPRRHSRRSRSPSRSAHLAGGRARESA